MYPNAVEVKKTWMCRCGSTNPETIGYCLSCRREKQVYSPEPQVKCPHCGANNSATNMVCFACNKSLVKRPATVVVNIPKNNDNAFAAPPKAMSEFGKALETLAQLSKLHEQGILTDEEFQKKKAEVLDRA